MDGDAEGDAMMGERRRRSLAIVIVAALGVSATGADGSVKRETLEGKFFRAPDSHVSISIKVRNDRPVGGMFTAANVIVACEGFDLDDRVSFPAARIRFVDRDTFVADSYDDGTSTGVESLVSVRADLDRKRSVAQGTMFAFANPLNDPAAPECTTRTFAEWHAD